MLYHPKLQQYLSTSARLLFPGTNDFVVHLRLFDVNKEFGFERGSSDDSCTQLIISAFQVRRIFPTLISSAYTMILFPNHMCERKREGWRDIKLRCTLSDM